MNAKKSSLSSRKSTTSKTSRASASASPKRAASQRSTRKKAAGKTAGKTAAQSRKKSASPSAPATSQRRGGAAAKNNHARARRVHLISDFTGNLANHLVSSVLSQFPDPKIEKRYHLFVDTPDKLDKVLKRIRSRNDLVLHSVVNSQAKQTIAQTCADKEIPCFDLTGPLSQFLGAQLDLDPQDDPERLHQIDSEYFKRIDAMEFTLQHDDSRRLESIDQADIVLLGISRVSKSPTSTFLGSLGFRTANVSIAPDLGLPRELKSCRGRVCALTMQPAKLYEIRQRRFVQNGFAERLKGRDELQLGYLNPRDVAREVMDAEKLYRQNRLPIVDVTGMTIEESAAHVIQALKLLPGD